MALQCSLIEFLASTLVGRNYKHIGAIKCEVCDKTISKTDGLDQFEYNRSTKLFTDFIKTVTPFSSHFTSSNLSSDFYQNVRCALLHEARTKGGWRILAENEESLVIKRVNEEKIIYRNNLQKLFEKYVICYGKKLAECPALQKAFIRKYDFLCLE